MGKALFWLLLHRVLFRFVAEKILVNFTTGEAVEFFTGIDLKFQTTTRQLSSFSAFVV